MSKRNLSSSSLTNESDFSYFDDASTILSFEQTWVLSTSRKPPRLVELLVLLSGPVHLGLRFIYRQIWVLGAGVLN